MGPDYAALASAAATALVAAMANEGWEGIRSAVVRLWRRANPGRAPHIEAALEHSRQELAGTSESLAEEAKGEFVAEWQGKLRRLLVAHPELVNELDDVLGFSRQHVGEIRFGSVVHHGIGDVNQAGRDISISPTADKPYE
jgi:hypothetical protein